MSDVLLQTDKVMAEGSEKSETHDRILDAAESLFGEQGFVSTSVRDIAARADTSPGSINYYFGSKKGLIRAVIHRVAEPVTRARLERLSELRAQYGADPVPVRDILESFLEPLFKGTGERRRESISRLLAQVSVATDPQIGQSWIEVLGSTGVAYVNALRSALPHLSSGEVFLRYQFFLMASYDIRAFSSWYQSWVATSFGSDVNNITLEQRIRMFEQLFAAQETGPAPTPSPTQT